MVIFHSYASLPEGTQGFLNAERGYHPMLNGVTAMDSPSPLMVNLGIARLEWRWILIPSQTVR